MQVHHHDHSGFHRNSKQRDVAHPHRHAEVVPQPPLEDESSGQRIKGGEDQHCGFRDRMKHQVEQKKNHEKHHRQNQRKALFGPDLEFVLA